MICGVTFEMKEKLIHFVDLPFVSVTRGGLINMCSILGLLYEPLDYNSFVQVLILSDHGQDALKYLFFFCV